MNEADNRQIFLWPLLHGENTEVAFSVLLFAPYTNFGSGHSKPCCNAVTLKERVSKNVVL